MKYKLYSIPEYINILSSKDLLYTESTAEEYVNNTKYNYNMYVFTDWVEKKLNSIYKADKQFIPGQVYKLELSPKDDIPTIISFAQYCKRMSWDQLSKICPYEVKINKLLDEAFHNNKNHISKKISMECFRFIGREKRKNKEDLVNAVAFTISTIHNASTGDTVDAYIELQCISYK